MNYSSMHATNFSNRPYSSSRRCLNLANGHHSCCHPLAATSSWRCEIFLEEGDQFSRVIDKFFYDIISISLIKAKSSSRYEKLVAPLLSRLSSSSSGGGRDEDSKEWVWLGKARTDTNSIGWFIEYPSVEQFLVGDAFVASVTLFAYS